MKVLASALVLGGFAAVFVFHPLTPSLPRPGIDPSWVAVMGEAADRPARFGVDTAFTYGPASPVVTGYLDASWATRTLPLQLGFAMLFGWCAALLVARRRPARDAAWGTGAVALVLVLARDNVDALFLTLPFPVLLLAVRTGKAEAIAAGVGAAALGLTAMVKTSFPLAALPLLALADGTALARGRAPRLLPLFALGVVGAALLYGQRLSDLPAYAAMQGEVVAGYAAAMAIDGPDWDLYPFLALGLGLVAAAALLRPGPHRAPTEMSAADLAPWCPSNDRDPVALSPVGTHRWPVATGLAASLLFLFKAGFIRHDLHSVTAWTGLALVAVLLGWSRLSRRAALGLTAAAGFVSLVYVPVMTVRQSVRDGRGAALARIYGEVAEAPLRQAAAAWDALRDPPGFRARLGAAKAAAFAGIARDMPLGDLPGPVDVVPSIQSAVLAAGLDYRGRPSFQEYSTYTARLAEANRAFLLGPEAPRWVLFGPESPEGDMAIDGRFPSLAEGPLWPDLLRLYRPHHRIGRFLALERRAAPARAALGPAQALALRFGTFAPVDRDGPTWATVEVKPNLAGRALSALFRPPLLTLAVKLDDGSERRFRLVPALAAAGFLLSPLVDDASDYEALAAGRPAGAARRVTAFAVEASGAGRMFYAPAIAATLRGLDVPATGEPAPPPPGGRIDVSASGFVNLPIGGLPATGGRRRVDLGYGLDGEAPRRTCFAVHPADGTRATLWSACLDPGAASGLAALDVPDGVEELALETRCGGRACAAFWSVGSGDRAAGR